MTAIPRIRYVAAHAAQRDFASAVRRNVLAYDQRHGYRGPEDFVALPKDATQRDKLIESTLQKHPSSDKLLAAVVTRVSAKNVHAILANGDDIDIAADGLRWAAAALAPKAPAALQIKPGSVIRVVSGG